jgi:hypothetical protein
MPGGFGGTDIYVCERVGDSWDKPKNLGDKINTSGMELFPHIRKDGLLFYSSDKFDGFGGLDIFSAEKVNGIWQMIRNEGIGINSISDDFGIYFSDTANGYFSSNRQGSDDVFSFYFERKFIDFEGYVLNSKDTSDVAVNIKIDLKDKNGNYYEMAGDCAFMYPMLELARERTKFINDVLYVYNRTNPISDDKVNLIKQEASANEIKLKKINERLASL